MKKKVLSIFFVALLLVVQLTLPAFAADTESSAPALKLTASYDKAAKQVTATVSLGPCTGLQGLQFDLTYDEAVLSVNSQTKGSMEQCPITTTAPSEGLIKLILEGNNLVETGFTSAEEQTLLTVVFDVHGSGNSTLRLSNVALTINNSSVDGENLTAVVKLPGASTTPTTPTTPTSPVEPSQPEKPSQPVDPPQPEKPSQPVDPSQPEKPSQPVEPSQPENPSQPTEPSQPEKPSQPVDPSQPSQPTDPEHPTNPERTIEKVGGAENTAVYTLSSDGNTLNVKNDVACVVLWTVDNGKTYTKLAATANENGGYDFDLTGVPENVVIKIAIKGDANGDGGVNSADGVLLNRSLLEKSHSLFKELSGLQKAMLDLNGDGEINSADGVLLNRSLLESTHSLYRALTW